MSSRILLLSADFGSGHLAAAKAIAAHCRAIDPAVEAEPHQVKCAQLDAFSWGYLRMIDWAPAMYRKLYHLPVGWPLRHLLLSLLARRIKREVRRFRPDVIVGTHPFPAGVAAYCRAKGQLDVPVVMALTDFLPHGFWVWEGVDRYCVSSESAAGALAQMGVDRSRIAITGVAIRPEFAEVSQLLSLRPDRDPHRRVLVMGGGLGLGPIVEAVRALASLPQPELRVTVICGTNKALEQDLLDLFSPDPRVAVVGYTTRVAEYMAASDLLITKPGGITCSEAMALSLPMLLLSPLPGHEEENAGYLCQTGAALVTSETLVGDQVAELLFHHPERLVMMKEQARLNGRPHAAERIANEILVLSAQNPHLSATVG